MFDRFSSLRTATLLVGAAAVAAGAIACGDDDDGGGGGGGSDEEYVAAICDAFLQFQNDITDIINDPDNADATEEEAVDLFLEPLEAYVDALDDANPPSDVESYHNQLVDSAREAVNRVREEGTLEAFDELAEPEEPPQEIQDRLQAVANENPTCVEADFTFDDSE